MKDTFDLTVTANERVGALGKTGSGKTFFMLRLLTQLENTRIVIVDTKRTIRLPNFKIEKDAKKAAKGKKVIYRPERSTKPPPYFYNQIWSKYGAERKPDVVVYVDEAAHVTSPQKIEPGLELLVQAGREVGIGLWWAGQQSTQINNWLLSQTEKLFVFKLPVESDRKKVAGVVGDTVDGVGTLENYHFHAYGFPEVEGIQGDDGTETYILTLEEDIKNGGKRQEQRRRRDSTEVGARTT